MWARNSALFGSALVVLAGTVETAPAQKAYRYSARMAVPLASPRDVATPDVAWSCKGIDCVGKSAAATPTIAQCAALAAQVGRVTEFANDLAKLEPPALVDCAKGIGVAKPDAGRPGGLTLFLPEGPTIRKAPNPEFNQAPPPSAEPRRPPAHSVPPLPANPPVVGQAPRAMPRLLPGPLMPPLPGKGPGGKDPISGDVTLPLPDPRVQEGLRLPFPNPGTRPDVLPPILPPPVAELPPGGEPEPPPPDKEPPEEPGDEPGPPPTASELPVEEEEPSTPPASELPLEEEDEEPAEPTPPGIIATAGLILEGSAEPAIAFPPFTAVTVATSGFRLEGAPPLIISTPALILTGE